jgi:hypothetical protein
MNVLKGLQTSDASLFSANGPIPLFPIDFEWVKAGHRPNARKEPKNK